MVSAGRAGRRDDGGHCAHRAVRPLTDTDRLRACYQIVGSGWAVDNPGLPPESFATFGLSWRDWDGYPRRAFLATDSGGEPAGCCVLVLPQDENVRMAFGGLMVPPARRRRGLGTQLLAHCAEQVRQAGRSKLSCPARDGSPGAAFALAHGAQGGIEAVMRTTHFGPELPATLAALRPEAQQRAAGYDLLSWLGPTPDEHLDQLARVHRAMADAPRDDSLQAIDWDADRFRTIEAQSLAGGSQLLTVAARSQASGELAAFTQVSLLPGMPEWAGQGTTVVAPEHRGQRPGLLVKIAMLDLLAEHAPEVRHITTGNAGRERAHDRYQRSAWLRNLRRLPELGTRPDRSGRELAAGTGAGRPRSRPDLL
jgi:GNAT superfamily N-acetyltransferase